MKNVGLIFLPSFYFWARLFFFFGWKDRENENFGKKITSTKPSFGKNFFQIIELTEKIFP
jgi:hypothetical protein